MVPSAANGRHNVLNALLYIGKGLAITAALVLAKITVEHLPLGVWVEKQTYGALAKLLPQFRSTGQDVVVLDIGYVPGGSREGGSGSAVTSRDTLRKIIEALAKVEALAIGIDIDFSPFRTGWVDENDPEFFNYCLSLQNTLPVRLGVFRSIRERKQGWLGAEKFAPLAGALWLPKSDELRLPIWLRAKGSDDELPSLASALANSVAHRLNGRARWQRALMAETTEIELDPEYASSPVRVGVSIINYASVHQIEREAKQVTRADPAFIAANPDVYRGRVVILGDVRGGTDSNIFPIPTSSNNRRGIIVHAAATQTLIRDTIWEFSHTARLAIDFGVSFCILTLLAFSKWRTPKGSADEAHHREQSVVVWAVITVSLIGVGLVLARIMWLDFALVGFFLLLHPKVEEWLHKRFATHHITK